MLTFLFHQRLVESISAGALPLDSYLLSQVCIYIISFIFIIVKRISFTIFFLMQFSMTICTYQLTLINLSVILLHIKIVKRELGAYLKIFIFWVDMMELQSSNASIITTYLTFTAFILNKLTFNSLSYSSNSKSMTRCFTIGRTTFKAKSSCISMLDNLKFFATNRTNTRLNANYFTRRTAFLISAISQMSSLNILLCITLFTLTSPVSFTVLALGFLNYFPITETLSFKV